ncbi:hypothetical protein BST97_02120 [Nonlabens spongiae]|uniref:HTH araC/xylS-type domain-containing protein n=1 Tax=Nonlabens spongiae TaxID=331648 RepID=A0A1W6MH36_9FLAO|nr:AraC family transcriptional regulator [Nonlabens spongiae]ARN76892.1 hypothetical protein BST97_02120 [Nonlabens spongiae]
METLKVKSLPIKDVLNNLADEMGGKVVNDCEVYSLKIPQEYGTGFIRGVNFTNGLAWVQYDCKFKQDVEIRFTVNQVHPLKFLYNLSDPFIHTFENDDELHTAEQFKNLIVASKNTNGHILRFHAQKSVKLNSIEIDRERFEVGQDCYYNQLNETIKNAILDSNAESRHFLEGGISLKIAHEFRTIDHYKYDNFIRKMFLAGRTYEILALQLRDYNTVTIVEDSDPTPELMLEIDALLQDDFSTYGSVRAIATKLKIPESKLQHFFKKYYGMTGNEFLKQHRMDLIVELLEESSLSIKEIAKLVGIENSSYLSKIFKSKFKLTPAEYRKRC